MPGRKATDLNPDVEGQDSRATEGNNHAPLVEFAQGRFFGGQDLYD